MSKIILINIHPKHNADVHCSGLLYLATYLQNHGISARIFLLRIGDDKQVDGENMEQIKKELEDCECVGFSVMTAQVPKSLAVTKIIKKLKPGVKIVWGGVHPTLFPEQTVENENIDFAILREGEQPLLELMEKLVKNQSDFETINGLVFKRNGRIIQNPPQPLFKNFENMRPNLDLVADYIKDNLDILILGKRYRCVIVHTGRGCPHRCTYCINKNYFGNSRRMRSMDLIVSEIKELIERYNPTLISLNDENFFVNKAKVEEFCHRLKKENLDVKWIADCRANYFDNYDDSFLNMLKESGCISLHFGAESGSKKILEYIKKDITPEQILNAAGKCVKHEIFPIFSFMIGFPNETKEDILATLDIMQQLTKISSKVGFTLVHILRPQPGGEIYKDCIKYGFNEPKTLEDWEKNNNVYFSEYLNAKHLQWIKDPESVELIAKYMPKAFNVYMTSAEINCFWRALFKIRANMLSKMLYTFTKTDNAAIKNTLEKCLTITNGISEAGKAVLTKTKKGFGRL